MKLLTTKTIQPQMRSKGYLNREKVGAGRGPLGPRPAGAATSARGISSAGITPSGVASGIAGGTPAGMRSAVALSYDRESMAAPLLTAMGVHESAGRICRLARRYGVPVEQRGALAQQLADHIRPGETISERFYGDVADIFGRLGSRARR